MSQRQCDERWDRCSPGRTVLVYVSARSLSESAASLPGLLQDLVGLWVFHAWRTVGLSTCTNAYEKWSRKISIQQVFLEHLCISGTAVGAKYIAKSKADRSPVFMEIL